MGINGTITVKDIALRAQVSVGTVSRVFHQQSNVGEEIRKRVLRAAEDLGYKRTISQEPHRQSRPLKEIGFLYCSALDPSAMVSNPFWSHILNGAEREAQKANIKLTYTSIYSLLQTPKSLLAAVQEMKLDGILMVGPAEKEAVQILKTLQIPLVLVDNYIPGLSADSVLCDNFEGARLAINYFIEQGHRQIAFIGGPLTEVSRPLNKIYTLERRSAGYRAALLDAGLLHDYRLYEASQLSPQSGSEACKRLFKSEVPFTAIFCANDDIAIGALKSVREHGKRVPEDVSVIGFDDLALVEHLVPALTTIRVNKEAMGAMAVKVLLNRAADPDMVAVSCILEVELIKRETVCPPAAEK